MADGFTVDRAALTETAQGLNDVIGQLTSLGLSESADVGRGFSELALSGQQAGDGNLAGAFSDFCDRWSWGVRALVQDGNQFAQRLGLSAGLYNTVENQNIGALKDLTASALADPHLTDTQAENSSWAQATGRAQPNDPNANMTDQQAVKTMENQWETVGKSIPSSELVTGGMTEVKK